MRVVFYSPIAEPEGAKASGIARVGALLVRALARAGCSVTIPPFPITYDGRGDAARQMRARDESAAAAAEFLARVKDGREPKPDLWFSYHVYYKSPDWIGPHIAHELNIPYIVAEGSHAPKRANGAWAMAHDATTAALKAADRLLAMTSFDRVCLEWIAADRVRDLKPFIDTAPFTDIDCEPADGAPRLIAVGMMGNERKRASYRFLAEALSHVHAPWRLTIAGDGPGRSEIERAFAPFGARVRWLGAVPYRAIPALLLASDIFAWPGLGEAYGLVYLEAQAAGIPIVACSDRGVPDVVRAGETALLSAPGDAAAYAQNLQALLEDESRRFAMGDKGNAFVCAERDLDAAARTLKAVIGEIAPR